MGPGIKVDPSQTKDLIDGAAEAAAAALSAHSLVSPETPAGASRRKSGTGGSA